MGISISLPEMNIKEEELKLLLAIKLLEEGSVSLGKAAETSLCHPRSAFSLQPQACPVQCEVYWQMSV
jgi:hypothetical protein